MTTDIVPFAKLRPPPTQKPQGRQSRRDQIMRQRGQALSPEQNAAADAIAIELAGTPRPWTAEDRAANVAMVVRIAIRSAKCRGVSLQSMLPIPRGWLLKLCDEGDPTCLVVRDWLLGNLAHLPDGFEGSFSIATVVDRGDA